MTNHSWSTTRLSNLTSDLRQLLKVLNEKKNGRKPLQRFICIELRDIGADLELINNLSQKLEEATQELGKYWSMSPPGQRYQKESPYREQLLQASKSLELVRGQLIFCMKALHDWLYHLKESFNKEGIERSQIGDSSWENLKACCDIRNKLITHKEKTQDDLIEEVSSSLLDGSIELDLVPYAPSKQAVESLEKLLKKLPDDLNPDSLTAKERYYESVELLVNVYDRLSGELKEEWHNFIKSHGSISFTSLKIAELVLEISKKLIEIFDSQKKL